MPTLKNIVVFTNNINYLLNKNIVEINRAIPNLNWLILIYKPRKMSRKALNAQFHYMHENINVFFWLPHIVKKIWAQIPALPSKKLERHNPGYLYTMQSMQEQTNIRFEMVEKMDSPTTLDMVKSFSPILGLSIGSSILPKVLYSIPILGTLNLHKGKLPDYRGMPPVFWELWNDEVSIGCTVHRVNDKLDNGDILCQTSIDRSRYSNLKGLQLQLDEVGIHLMLAATKQVLNGSAITTPQSSIGKLYCRPSNAECKALDFKLKKLQPQSSPFLIHSIKRMRSELGIACGNLGLLTLLTPRITVLLYHRVCDEVRNNVTVGIEQFDRQMQIIRKYCTPISIQEVLSCKTAIPRSRRPLVSVTFDDGYLDNYTNAVPILLKHGIDATFFVSTEIITVQGTFPHDAESGNTSIPNMNWDQLREIRNLGFTIGSHTLNHIDCAAEPEDIVRFELNQSLEHLIQQLGKSEYLFAYPYGGRQHMTPQRLELVKESGYAGCVSAYGGSNIGSVDRFNVLRQGIDWKFADRDFLFKCYGI